MGLFRSKKVRERNKEFWLYSAEYLNVRNNYDGRMEDLQYLSDLRRSIVLNANHTY